MLLSSWIQNIAVWVYQRKDGMAMEKMHVPIERQKKKIPVTTGGIGDMFCQSLPRMP